MTLRRALRADMPTESAHRTGSTMRQRSSHQRRSSDSGKARCAKPIQCLQGRAGRQGAHRAGRCSKCSPATRRFEELLKTRAGAIAPEALRRFAELHHVEREIAGKDSDGRLAMRQQITRPLRESRRLSRSSAHRARRRRGGRGDRLRPLALPALTHHLSHDRRQRPRRPRSVCGP
jgi:hypothetical protein